MNVSRNRSFSAGLLCCLLVVLSTMCFAQPQPPREMTTETMLAQLQKDLTLTEAQVEQIRPIIEADMAKHKALMNGARTSGDRDAVRSEMEALRKDTDAKIAACLTDEQKNILNKIRSDRGTRMGNEWSRDTSERPEAPAL